MATAKKATTKKAAKRAPRKTKAVSEEAVVEAPQTESKKAGERYIYAVGRRKTAVAQVRLYPQSASSDRMVNQKKAVEYFGTEALASRAFSPLKTVGKENDFAVTVLVRGGGTHGQADAVKLGVARALVATDEGLRPVLRAEGLLTRDSRAVERKKPGLKKARRSPQWAKR